MVVTGSVFPTKTFSIKIGWSNSSFMLFCGAWRMSWPEIDRWGVARSRRHSVPPTNPQDRSTATLKCVASRRITEIRLTHVSTVVAVAVSTARD